MEDGSLAAALRKGERREFAAALFAAVEALGEPDRSLVEGYYYEDRRLKDLARALGLSPAQAKTRLFRARQRLKITLTKGGSADGTDG